MTAAGNHNQTAMKRLAGALSLVCLVLFLLAIEQRHTVAIWETLRDEAVPAARRVAGWTARLPSEASAGLNGLSGLKTAAAGEAALLAASPDASMDLKGEYGPADEAARAPPGALSVAGAELRLENGDVLRTRPLRIAAGGDVFGSGQTFARRLNAPAGSQIELREVVPPPGVRTVPPLKLCGGEAAVVAALLHRRDRLDLMLFRAAPGADAPAGNLCGVWSFTAR